MSVSIIAEAGVNHNGSLALAHELIDVAVEAGADVVKFQTFHAEDALRRDAPKAQYQIETTGSDESQLEMAKKLELSLDEHRELRDHCHRAGIEFLSTPFDLRSVDALVGLGLKKLKFASGEITNGPLLLKMAQTELPLIISTGMCTLDEIEAALGVVAFGYLGWNEPSLARFAEAFASDEGQHLLRERVVLLHCTTQYPAPMESINLRAMNAIRERFALPVGYSDHSLGITVPIAAVACGAAVIEKHITTDRNLPGPDHRASLEPEDLRAMVRAIRDVEKALGDGRKVPDACETANRVIARKSLVASKPIAAGEMLSADNLAVKRPADGRSPMLFWETIGTLADHDYVEDEVIR